MSNGNESSKRAKISQADMPNITFDAAAKIAHAMWDNFAGKGTAPHNVALALDLSPTSGGWRNLCGASIAYGLTDGGYNANTIELTELGRQLVAPTSDGQDIAALRQAVLKPRIQGEFFRQYDRAKFPKESIAANVLTEKGIPKERAAKVVEILLENGKRAGFLKETKTGLFVAIEGHQEAPSTNLLSSDVAGSLEMEPAYEDNDNSGGAIEETASINTVPDPKINNRVFITHGKNTAVLEQIKKVVTLGGFAPIVSVQTESIAKPIPEKVLSEMKSCSAAVIHVGSEGSVTDGEGQEIVQINPNVLIEIGASLALYDNRFILVVEEGVKLPSNLQGLYECRYSGSDIGLEAGLKVLEALRGLR